MEQLKHFTQEGHVYKLKPQYVFNSIFITLLLLVAALGAYMQEPMMMWIPLIVAILAGISMFNKSLIIDMNNKEIRVRKGLIPIAATIPITDIQNFELFAMKQLLITTNTMLNVYYLKNEKRKSANLAQGFTKKAMQNILNEIQEIIDYA
ncbi:hypothetical protein LZQ00_04615 [Sphingobacterium sp. SRCM116780]|uniref:hypothetical protein n=1 Tax=Sphingobacterium sp. SRCM116780 TaxID=2907623 RepID=UPI001F3C3323|nr:hypothetical protein [Sphingobacterium sp. SRCM116780]UIR57098.1 hypothetical protein LZQ00_04615 [Sphingobacterium sp. SRCM116780]